MKSVVSISLGSSKRNHSVEIELGGEKYKVERIGTDGDMKKMIEMIRDLDGRVEAFGLGGMDLYVYAGNRRYTLRDAKKVVAAAQKTPIVDGSGLKNTLERKVILYLKENTGILDNSPSVLLMSGADRFGMAEAFVETGCKLNCGDLAFVLGLPVALRSLRALDRVARVLAPIVTQLPMSMLYPTGKKQEENSPKFPHFFEEAGIVAGDFHFIRRYMPHDMKGKVIITNTTTPEDVDFLKERGVKTLVTTTPELNGRSFGTNVMEALLIAASGKKKELPAEEYSQLLSEFNFVPRITELHPDEK